MDLAARLRENARRADERRVLVLAGDADRSRDRARAALDASGITPGTAPVLGPTDLDVGPQRPQREATALLGETHPAIVLDCHAAFRPNALGVAAGAVDGGGLLVVLTPPLAEWPERRDDFDAGLAVPPFERSAVEGHFRRRLVRTLRQHRGIAIVDVDSGTVERDGLTRVPPRLSEPAPTPPATHDFPAAAYEACLTTDQAEALGHCEDLLEPGRAIVLSADRGRGKSSAAGLAAACLARAGLDVLVTAPAYRNAAPVFERAEALLTDLGEVTDRDRGESPRRLETDAGGLRYEPPERAVDLPGEPDRLIVDEAAALPVRRLESFLEAAGALFATTIHGYEGAGRGFSVRFRDRLADSALSVTDVDLSTPIRYAPADPVEVWAFRALSLDARPAVDPLVTGADPDTVTYRHLDQAALAADEHLLREVVGLLVVAHYRTEPNDVARLLDAPNVTVRALCRDGHVASVALLAREGGLPADLRADMYEGARVRGNMLPDVLTSQLRDETAGEPVGYRVMRIATHPAVRSRGLGSHLLDRIGAELGDAVDWLGVGYGATPELVSFWRANGYRTVHLSTTRNDTSGEHSAIMLDPTSPAGRSLADRHAEWFTERVAGMLSDPLSGLDSDVVREVLRSVDRTPTLDLSDREWRVLAGVPHGAAIFDTAPEPFRRLALRHLVDPAGTDLLSARQERLLVTKVLQARPWSAVSDDLAFHSRSTCMRTLGETVGELLECYGTEFARSEGRRFE